MANSTREPPMTDFLETFLAQPQQYKSQVSKETLGSSRFPEQHHLQATSLGLSASGFTATPQLQQEFLSAQTFTDVLANVASDWHPGSDPSQAWGGSLLGGAGWSLEQPGSTATASGGQRFASLTDCSSNNSGEAPLPVKQEDLTSAAAADSDGDSDVEVHAAAKPNSGASKAKGTSAGRAEQRRTRKREKDRIEEMQASILKQTEDVDQLRAQADELQRRLQEKDEELRRLRAAEESALPAAEDDQLAASFEGTVTLTIEEGRSIVLTPEQIRGLSREDISNLYTKYVARLRHLLQSLRHLPPGPQQEQVVCQISALQREAIILLIRSAIGNIATIKQLYSSPRADGAADSSPPPQFWQRVSRDMHLSPSQKGHMLELWQSFQGKISKLIAVRSSIHIHLSSTIPDGVFGRSFAINFLKAHELMDALKYNLRQEHIVMCDLAAHFHRILMPVQNASCIVSSWPFWPNVPQIAHVVAEAMAGI